MLGARSLGNFGKIQRAWTLFARQLGTHEDFRAERLYDLSCTLKITLTLHLDLKKSFWQQQRRWIGAVPQG